MLQGRPGVAGKTKTKPKTKPHQFQVLCCRYRVYLIFLITGGFVSRLIEPSVKSVMGKSPSLCGK